MADYTKKNSRTILALNPTLGEDEEQQDDATAAEEPAADIELRKKHEEAWKEYGCTIMSDGWTDTSHRHLINFLANSPAGTFFLGSVDASSEIANGPLLADLLEKQIDKVGKEHVVQIVTDNGANFKAAGRLLMERIPHLFWTPCAAHCLDLLLEDIGKINEFNTCINMAKKVCRFMYKHGRILDLMRDKIGGDLVRPAITRFATSFLTLASMHKNKTGLRNLVVSEEWQATNFSSTTEGRQVENIILSMPFWNKVELCIRATQPLLVALRIADGDETPAAPEIMAAMDHAKAAIKDSLKDKPNLLKEVLEYFDKRWENQMEQQLYGAALYLNPSKYFAIREKDRRQATKLRIMFNQVMWKMVSDDEDQNKISKQAMTMRVLWWGAYGGLTYELQCLAKRIVSLCCSASGCERNWSEFSTENEWVNDNCEPIHEGAANAITWANVDDAIGATQGLEGRNLPRAAAARTAIPVPVRRTYARKRPRNTVAQDLDEIDDEEQDQQASSNKSAKEWSLGQLDNEEKARKQLPQAKEGCQGRHRCGGLSPPGHALKAQQRRQHARSGPAALAKAAAAEEAARTARVLREEIAAEKEEEELEYEEGEEVKSPRRRSPSPPVRRRGRGGGRWESPVYGMSSYLRDFSQCTNRPMLSKTNYHEWSQEMKSANAAPAICGTQLEGERVSLRDASAGYGGDCRSGSQGDGDSAIDKPDGGGRSHRGSRLLMTVKSKRLPSQSPSAASSCILRSNGAHAGRRRRRAAGMILLALVQRISAAAAKAAVVAAVAAAGEERAVAAAAMVDAVAIPATIVARRATGQETALIHGETEMVTVMVAVTAAADGAEAVVAAAAVAIKASTLVAEGAQAAVTAATMAVCSMQNARMMGLCFWRMGSLILISARRHTPMLLKR
ncbi:unnamed protein product [Miscanthus lutarioriparius]|uniref:DUF659 domain-containing protein n=1 Tax=Miscanthus lutarioriparius TaxID=422564 RepID=A0A811NRQ6_9POAL|nr:unnamed protein product [Miscanthus lutarioriparius]